MKNKNGGNSHNFNHNNSRSFILFLERKFFFNKQSLKTNFFYPILTTKTIAASLNAMMLNGSTLNKNDRRQY
jgi:hypothetical protein